MNKDEIKKAFECCISGICTDCPYYGRSSCRERLQVDAESLINGQEKEINFQVKDRARLQNELDELEMAYFQRAEELDYAKKDCDRAFQRFEAQRCETDALKTNNEEKCWKCIESKRVTAADYAKLQEEFANYQLASEKEIRAQIKQAKIDVLNELKEKYSTFGNTFAGWIAFIPADDIDKMIEELKK